MKWFKGPLKMITYLQFLTATEVAALVGVGIAIVFRFSERITEYGQLCGALSPFLLTQIGAAFAGNQLKTFLAQRGETLKVKNETVTAGG